jgi:hypothetical protein
VPVFAVLAEDLGVRGAQLVAHQDYLSVSSCNSSSNNSADDKTKKSVSGFHQASSSTTSGGSGSDSWLLLPVITVTIFSLAAVTLLRHWKGN